MPSINGDTSLHYATRLRRTDLIALLIAGGIFLKKHTCKRTENVIVSIGARQQRNSKGKLPSDLADERGKQALIAAEKRAHRHGTLESCGSSGSSKTSLESRSRRRRRRKVSIDRSDKHAATKRKPRPGESVSPRPSHINTLRTASRATNKLVLPLPAVRF